MIICLTPGLYRSAAAKRDEKLEIAVRGKYRVLYFGYGSYVVKTVSGGLAGGVSALCYQKYTAGGFYCRIDCGYTYFIRYGK